MIAAEQGKRHAYLMEIDQLYCDVIVARWEKFTGKEAVLEGDGRRFAEIRAERAAEKTEATP